MRVLAVATAFILYLHTPSFAQEPLYVAHDFHITEGGGFFEKTTKEMGSQQFQTMVSLSCVLFGADCSSQASAARKAFEIFSDEWISQGENFFITGRVLEHDSGSEEWRGSFDTLQGYEVCRAGLNYGDMSITGPSTFAVGIRRAGIMFKGTLIQGLSFYAVVPKNRPTRQWINANFMVEYVPIGTSSVNNCAPDNSIAWNCKGQNCNPLSRW